MPRHFDERGLGRLVRRRRWNAEDAGTVLKHLEGSGLSVREFAERHGVDVQRLYRWRGDLGAPPAVAPAPAFVEIKPVAREAIEVALRSGHVVRVPDGFSEETLRRIVAVLEGPVERC